MSQLSSFRIVRVTLALAVALWMAGAGCLLGCEKSVAAASTRLDQPAKSHVLVASGGACAHHRKNAKAGSSAPQVSDSPSAESAPKVKTTSQSAANPLLFAFEALPTSMMDCPLAVNATAALSNAGSDHANAEFALTHVNQLPDDSLEQTTALTPPPRLPNRGHTHLHCCVFLI